MSTRNVNLNRLEMAYKAKTRTFTLAKVSSLLNLFKLLAYTNKLFIKLKYNVIMERPYMISNYQLIL